MPVFLERYVLPLLAGIILTVAIGNVWDLTLKSRVAVTAVSIAIAFAVAHLVHHLNQKRAAINVSHDVESMPTINATPENDTQSLMQISEKHQPTIGFLPPPIETSNRDYIDLDVKYLKRLSDEFTSVHADKIRGEYKEKWVRVSVLVRDVYDSPNETMTIAYYSTEMNSPLDFYLYMKFDALRNSRLRLLRKNDLIVLDGRIESISLTTIRLEECELVRNIVSL